MTFVEPFDVGVFQVRTSLSFDARASTRLGGFGAMLVIVEFTGAVGALEPYAFVDTTVNAYSTWFSKPVTVHVVAARLAIQVFADP